MRSSTGAFTGGTAAAATAGLGEATAVGVDPGPDRAGEGAPAGDAVAGGGVGGLAGAAGVIAGAAVGAGGAPQATSSAATPMAPSNRRRPRPTVWLRYDILFLSHATTGRPIPARHGGGC